MRNENDYSIQRRSIIAVGLLVCLCSAGWTQWTEEQDAAYMNRFHDHFRKVEPVPTIEEYVSPKQYDDLYMGRKFDAALNLVNNDQGGIAWGWSYRMMSLNEMYRATENDKYLKANLKAIQTILSVRDDKLGKKLWTGKIAPAWGSEKYAERGRAIFAVHTGIIVYPMLDFLSIVKEKPALAKWLGKQSQPILKQVQESLAFHDPQWRDGPEEGEGHYIGLNQENTMEEKPLPGNRLSSMGRALWLLSTLTNDAQSRARAIAIGHYMQRRLSQDSDGAYYWPYWLPLQPVTDPIPKDKLGGEDVSHGSLTMALPILLESQGEVFNAQQMESLVKTVTQGFARLNNGMLFGDVCGNPKSNPIYVQLPARWLRLTPHSKEVYDRIADFYVQYQPKPGPLDLALLLRYSK